MTQAPALSVIVPVWNVEQFLPSCLDSIVAQTFTDFECILVDDGSPDASGDICNQYAAIDSRFSVIHQQNSGVSAARNTGLAVAQGEYVYFFDSDDIMCPHLLEYAVRTQKEHPENLAIWRSTSTMENFELLQDIPYSWKYCTQDEMGLIFLQIALDSGVNTKLFRRDILQKNQMRFIDINGVKNAPGEDREFSTQYMNLFFQTSDQGFCYLDQPMYFYRQDNPASIMTNQETEKNAPSPPQKLSINPVPDYCNTILRELHKKRTQYPTFFEDPSMAENSVRHYMRCLAYGVWSAHVLGERLPTSLWDHPDLQWMLAFCRKQRLRLPYYYPFRWRAPRLLARLYLWDETYDIRFYRAQWIFQHLPAHWI